MECLEGEDVAQVTKEGRMGEGAGVDSPGSTVVGHTASDPHNRPGDMKQRPHVCTLATVNHESFMRRRRLGKTQTCRLHWRVRKGVFLPESKAMNN